MRARATPEWVTALERKPFQAIAEARPLTQDTAVIEAAISMVKGLIGQLREVNKAIQSFDDTIEATCAKLPDYAIFKPLPGAGAALALRLLAAFGENRERFPSAASSRSPNAAARRAGCIGASSAPPSSARASSSGSVRPSRGPFWAKAFYERHRAKGVSHNATIRALAFKWIRILWRCWHDRVWYDESTCLAALKRRGSPLLKFAAESSA